MSKEDPNNSWNLVRHLLLLGTCPYGRHLVPFWINWLSVEQDEVLGKPFLLVESLVLDPEIRLFWILMHCTFKHSPHWSSCLKHKTSTFLFGISYHLCQTTSYSFLRFILGGAIELKIPPGCPGGGIGKIMETSDSRNKACVQSCVILHQ